MAHFEFDAELWLYEGDAAWHFITVPEDARCAAARDCRGGRVTVSLGTTDV